jgi:hypothetical protein
VAGFVTRRLRLQRFCYVFGLRSLLSALFQ